MSAFQMLVLADDLTGVADTGVAFAAAGLDSGLLLQGRPQERLPEPAEHPEPEVLCVDTDTRGSAPDAAAAAVRSAFRAAGQVYKKVDSTLRGNVAAEIAAAFEVSGSDIVVLAPAFPATGRTTIDGSQRVDGAPLASTDLWRGAQAPASIPDLFKGSGLRTGQVELPTVRAGGERVAAELRTHAVEGTRVVVCDAETEADLDTVAAAGVGCGDLRILWAGSGGLAHSLIGPLGLGSVAVPAPLPRMGGAGSLLAVIGSATARCKAQARALVSSGFREVALPARTLLDGTDADLAALSARLSAAVRAGSTAAVIADGEMIADRGGAAEAAAALGRVVGSTTHPGAGLLLTGGETARAVLTAAGVRTLRLLGEVEPGVVVSHADPLGALPVVTKAGAFGDDDALVRAAHVLRGNS